MKPPRSGAATNDRKAAYWWSDSESPVAIIRYMINPVRFACVIRQLVELSYDYRSKKVLDIGCSGVFCLDVLEHVRDFRTVVSEISRVLVPGGFFFETGKRTILSYLVVIFFIQEFPLTRVMPANIHNWGYFIRPGELSRASGPELCLSSSAVTENGQHRANH